MKKSHALFAFVTLTVLLTAGAAQSLSGSNTVYGDDIVNGTITSADVKLGSIYGTRLADSSVTGRKLKDASVTGADVNEPSLNMAGNCSSGMIQGTVLLQGASANFGATYGTAGRIFTYNCNGGEVLVKRAAGFGVYDVKFVGSGHRAAIATIDNHSNPNGARYATVDDFGAGELQIITFNAAGTIVDGDVEVLFW